jgi:hypothetical protein
MEGGGRGGRGGGSLIYPTLFVRPRCDPCRLPFFASAFPLPIFIYIYIYIFFFPSLSLSLSVTLCHALFFSVVSSDAPGISYGRGGNTYLRGCPRLAPRMARQQFSPPGNLQQFFITRRDNVFACSVLLPLPPSPTPRHEKVSCLPVRSDTGRPHLAGHDNVFIIHRIIRRVGGNQVGRYYAPTIGCVESVIYRRAGQKEVWPGRVSSATFR